MRIRSLLSDRLTRPAMPTGDAIACTVVATAFPMLLGLRDVGPLSYLLYAYGAGPLVALAQEALLPPLDDADLVDFAVGCWMCGTKVLFLGSPFYTIAYIFG